MVIHVCVEHEKGFYKLVTSLRDLSSVYTNSLDLLLCPYNMPYTVVCFFDSLRPINNLSVIKERVFLG